MRTWRLTFPLLLLAACTSSAPKTPPGALPLGPLASSSTVSSAPAAPGANATTAQGPAALEGPDEQLLKLAVTGEPLGGALNFRKGGLLTTFNHALELGPSGLKPASVNVVRDLAGDAVLGTTGEFPERAYVLTPKYMSCTLPDKNIVRRWNGKRWAALPTPGPEVWPQEQVVDLCSWGTRELALRLSRWYEDPISSRFEVLEERSVAAPVFAAAPSTPGYSEHHCETRLVAQRCVGLPSGTVVVAGTACDESGPAVEYFSAGSVTGKTLALPAAAAPSSFELTHVSVHDERVYVAGKQGSPQRGYLAAFSPTTGTEQIPLPKSAQNSLIRDLVATRDGSLWLNASPAAVEDGVVTLGLWRRDPSGRWHRQTLPSNVPEGTRPWVLSPAPSNNLAQAWGEVWLNAAFYDGDPNQKGTLSQEVILGARANLTPFAWRKKPGPSRAVSSPAAAATAIPCGP